MVCRRILSHLLIGLSACIPLQSPAESLHIAVASNFKHTHQALVNAFYQSLSESEAPDIKIQTSSGSSGTLFAQIKNGAPFDVYLSADAARPDRLITLGLASQKSRRVYAQGQIVLWQPGATKAVSIHSLIDTLNNKSARYVLANPDLAPYGAAAKVLMERHGAWKPRDPSRITAHNIATAFQYLASGTVPIGWVAMSQLRSWQQQHPVNSQSYWLADVNDYPKIQQVAVTLNRSDNKALATKFMSFMAAPDALSLIRSHGYLLPE